MNLKFKNDADLVAAVKRGGSTRMAAFRQIYNDNRLKLQVIRYVVNNSGNREDGEDTFHEAIIILDKKIREGTFKLDGSLNGFIYKTGQFYWMNQIRKQQRVDLKEDNQEIVKDDIDTHTPEQLFLQEEQKKLLQKVMNRLTQRCQQILTLWQLSYSMAEICKKMEISSEVMARKTKYRCMKSLIAFIKENNELTTHLNN